MVTATPKDNGGPPSDGEGGVPGWRGGTASQVELDGTRTDALQPQGKHSPQLTKVPPRAELRWEWACSASTLSSLLTFIQRSPLERDGAAGGRGGQLPGASRHWRSRGWSGRDHTGGATASMSSGWAVSPSPGQEAWGRQRSLGMPETKQHCTEMTSRYPTLPGHRRPLWPAHGSRGSGLRSCGSRHPKWPVSTGTCLTEGWREASLGHSKGSGPAV